MSTCTSPAETALHTPPVNCLQCQNSITPTATPSCKVHAVHAFAPCMLPSRGHTSIAHPAPPADAPVCPGPVVVSPPYLVRQPHLSRRTSFFLYISRPPVD